MGTTLVTGASGFVGSHVARALVERGDQVRVTLRASSSREALAGLDVEYATAQLGDRAALRRALRGVDRVFHVAGTTHLRASPAELSRVNVEGTRTVMEEALRAGVERVVHTSSIGAVGPARPHGTVDERSPFPAGLGVPYAESKHAAETEALRVAARGLAGRDRLPGARVRPRRPRADLDRRRPPLPAAPHPGLRPGRDQRGRRRRRRRRATCSPTSAARPASATSSARATTPGSACSPSSSRLSGIEGPALELPVGVALALAEAGARGPLRAPVSAAEVRAAGHWWTCRSTKARRELGWTTRPHEDTVEETVRWWEERLGDRLRLAPRSQPAAWRLVAAAARAVGEVGGRIVP